jgi:hypothetical protein
MSKVFQGSLKNRVPYPINFIAISKVKNIAKIKFTFSKLIDIALDYPYHSMPRIMVLITMHAKLKPWI